MDSDRILIYKMRQGDDSAWDAFIRKYYPDMLKYCYFHSQDRELAEDLTQEVFLKFFSTLGSYRHQGKAKNYLYTIAGNLCRDQYGKRILLPLEEALGQGSDEREALDERLELETAIRKLPEEFREVVVLHYYQELKLTEIAQVMKTGLPLVEYRLMRAKELLRKELDHGAE